MARDAPPALEFFGGRGLGDFGVWGVLAGNVITWVGRWSRCGGISIFWWTKWGPVTSHQRPRVGPEVEVAFVRVRPCCTSGRAHWERLTGETVALWVALLEYFSYFQTLFALINFQFEIQVGMKSVGNDRKTASTISIAIFFSEKKSKTVKSEMKTISKI